MSDYVSHEISRSRSVSICCILDLCFSISSQCSLMYHNGCVNYYCDSKGACNSVGLNFVLR